MNQTTQSQVEQLWKNAGQTATGEPLTLTDLLERIAEGAVDAELTPDFVASLLKGSRYRREEGKSFSSMSMAAFVSALASQRKVTSVLDPTCGSALLLRMTAETTGADIVHAVEFDAALIKVARSMLGPRATVHFGDFLAVRDQLSVRYDLIVADPPLGARLHADAVANFAAPRPRELAEAIAYWCCEHLAPDGLAILNVGNRLVWDERFRKQLNDSGCRLAGAIYVPSGVLPGTHISTHLILIEHGDQEKIFAARLPDNAEQIATVITNWKKRRQSGHPSLGCISEASAFLGYPTIEAEHQLRNLIRKTNYKPVAADQVLCGKPERFDPDKPDSRELSENEVVVDITGRVRIKGDPLPKNRHAFRLKLNPAAIDSAFFMGWMKSDLGRLVMRANTAGSSLELLSPRTLRTATYYLPDLETQRQHVAVERHIDRLLADLTETRALLWEAQTPLHDLEARLELLNREDKDLFWIETLPYPLASILWRHRTAEPGAVVRLSILKDFFEALAAFLATVHMSAFTNNDSVWENVQPSLISGLNKANTSLKLATFGTWKTVHATLAKALRNMLSSDDNRSLAFELYCTKNEAFLAAVSDSQLATVFDQANSLRNQFIGHGGAIGEGLASDLESRLLDLLEKVRAIFGLAWRSVDLIQPGQSTYRNGQHHYQVPRLMGTRSGFERVERATTTPMESGSLYLLGAAEAEGLKLLPFFRMAASNSPTACYFFNRCDTQGVRFVSYHDEQSPEILEPFTDTLAAIERVTGTPGMLNPGSDT
ncbi:MAG: hypothetical protein RLN76_13595 [Phycisphaeraceae bacterium]